MGEKSLKGKDRHDLIGSLTGRTETIKKTEVPLKATKVVEVQKFCKTDGVSIMQLIYGRTKRQGYFVILKNAGPKDYDLGRYFGLLHYEYEGIKGMLEDHGFNLTSKIWGIEPALLANIIFRNAPR